MTARHKTLERREIRFRGRVQGVGFRYTTQHVAKDFDVTGFVQNLPDGRVLLVAEGDSREIDRFVLAILQRLGHYVMDYETKVLPPTNEFRGFGILC